jgi:signal transduction histidine kinase
VYVFIYKEEASLKSKILAGLSLLPVIVWTPSHFNLVLFDATSCQAVEGDYFVQYYYALNLVVFLVTLLTEVLGYRKAAREDKKQIFLLALGVNLFLLSFFVTGYLASILGNFELVVYGLFGMVFFMALLGYLIVQYKAFDVKLLSVQALVTALVLLVGSQLFFVSGNVQFTLVGSTLIFLLILGRILVVSVQKEIRRKEELQTLTQELAEANQELKRLDAAKSEFISIASHQLRTPLTAIRGYISLVLEGSYGKVTPTLQDVLNKVYVVNNRMGQLVEDLLSISRIESGRVQYTLVETQMEPMVADLVDMFGR